MTQEERKPRVQQETPSLEDTAWGTPVKPPLAAKPAAEADLGV